MRANSFIDKKFRRLHMKKYLGQNFLVNSYVIDYIVSYMCIKQ